MSTMVKSPKTPGTDKRRRFVELYARSGNATQSARDAGYSDKSITSAASRLTRELALEIQQEIAHQIGATAPIALGAIVKLVSSTDTDDRVRLSAAKDILDRAGYNATNRVEVATMDNKSDDELRQELRELMGNVIDVTPEPMDASDS